MSRLNNYIVAQEDRINSMDNQIKSLQEQLKLLTKELRLENQKLKAQQSIEKELKAWLKQGQKLMQDLAPFYPEEALDDIVEDVKLLAEEVKENYDDHQTNSKFLKLEETEYKPDLPQLEESKTENEDDEIKEQLEDLSTEEIKRLGSMLGTKARTVKGVMKSITEMDLGLIEINTYINTIKNLITKSYWDDDTGDNTIDVSVA
jgi:chromosome segregation ATPase